MQRRPASIRWLALLPVVLLAPSIASAQLSWNIDYIDVTGNGGSGFPEGFNEPGGIGDQRRATVASALDYIASQIDARGTIQFTMDRSTTTPADVLAQSSPKFTTTIGFQGGVVFQRGTTGTVPAISGVPPDNDTSRFNFTDYQWNNGTGSPGSGEYDLFSVALHEFTHAMGFYSLIQSSGQGGAGSNLGDPDIYTVYDRNLQVGSTLNGDPLITSGSAFNTPTVQPSILTSGNVFFGGEYASLANGGTPVKIFAPGTFDPESSISHVDPSVSSAVNAVMQPEINAGDVRREYLAFEVGMLIDIGWNQYVWTAAGSEFWGNNTGTSSGSPWQNIQGQASYSPVGTITPNLVLTFGGSDPAGYTSTNNLVLSATAATDGDSNRFLVNRIVLNSTSTATNVIAAEDQQVLRFTTSIGIQPEIRQTNTAGFTISHPIELTNHGLVLGGKGTGVVTISGTIGEQSGQTGAITKTGSSEFILANGNTYSGGTTVSEGTLRVANLDGSATGTGAVLVEDGGVLGGVQNLPAGLAGFISGDVTVKDGGVIRPGDGTATLAGQINFNGAVQTLTFETGSRYSWSLTSLTTEVGDAGVGYDQLLIFNGDGLSLTSGQLFLAFNGTTTPGASSFWNSNQAWTILDVQSGNNLTQFASIVNPHYSGIGSFTLGSGVNGSIVLQFSPVPEPTTILGVSALALGLAAYRRRRIFTS